jgi:hypothetical protein
LLLAVAEASKDMHPTRAAVEALVAGKTPEKALKAGGMATSHENVELFRELAETDRLLVQDTETPAILHALDGGFIRPAPGGDLLRTPAILPTGRNLHGFDPFRLPERLRGQGRCAPSTTSDRASHVGGGQQLPRDHRARALGNRQPQDGGRTHRAGPVADRRAPAFRQLRPSGRRDPDPARRAGPSARRRGHDALGHLPRSAARCRPACWPRPPSLPPKPTSRSSRTSCASMHWPIKRRTAAIWRPPRCGSSAMPTGLTAPTSTTWSTAAAGTKRTSWPRPTRVASALPTGAPVSRSVRPSCSRACSPPYSWRTRTSTRSSSA